MRKILYLFLALSVLAGCNKSKGKSGEGNPRTMFVYLGGDNNLDDESFDKIDSLCKGMNGIDGKMVIYQDHRQRGARLYSVEPTSEGSYKAVQIKSYGEENSADPDIFRSAMNDALSYAPAESYGMLVFSHGSGWLPADTPELTAKSSYSSADNRPETDISRAIIQDGKDMMSITDMASVIPSGVFDFIVFEACLMGDITTVYELSTKVRYILASPAEIFSPGFTEIYPVALRSLYEPMPGGIKAFGERYMSHWRSDPKYPYATIALYDCSKVGALAEALREPLSEASFYGTGDYIDKVQRFGRNKYYRCFLDLEQFAGQFCSDAEKARIQEAIGQVVVYKDATSSFGPSNEDHFDITYYCGISVYPTPHDYPLLNREYRNTRLGRYIFSR